MPKIVFIDELKEGMELATPVKNKFGQVMLAENIKLEERHKNILMLWGIQSVYVKDSEEESEQLFDEDAVSNAKDQLKKRLTWNFRNFNEEEIYNLALSELLKKNMK
jgi:hypothetical protein